MWICQNCGAENDNGFDICWSCQVERDESVLTGPVVGHVRVSCIRCGNAIQLIGGGSFTCWDKWGWWWYLMAPLVESENFEIYSCSTCGQVELFLGGIGQEIRPQ